MDHENDQNKHPRPDSDDNGLDERPSKMLRSVAVDMTDDNEASASSDDIIFPPDVVSSSTTTPASAQGSGRMDFRFDDEDNTMTEEDEFTSENEERLVKNLAKLTLGVLSKDEMIKFLKSIYSWITANIAGSDTKLRNKQKYIASFGKSAGYFQIFIFMRHHLNDEEILRASVDVLSHYVHYHEVMSTNPNKSLLGDFDFDQLKVLLDAEKKFSTIMDSDSSDGSSHEIPPSSFVVLRRIWYLIRICIASITPRSSPEQSGCAEVINACLNLLEKLPEQDPDPTLVRNVRSCVLNYLAADDPGLNGMRADIGKRYLKFAMKHCDHADLEVLEPLFGHPSLSLREHPSFVRERLFPYCTKVIKQHKSCSRNAVRLIDRAAEVVSKQQVQKTGIIAALATTLESDDQQHRRDITILIKRLL